MALIVEVAEFAEHFQWLKEEESFLDLDEPEAEIEEPAGQK